MKRAMRSVFVLAALGIVSAQGALLGGEKEAQLVDSGKATFMEVAPGVHKAVLWGDHDKGPYGAFTKFAPGVKNGLHKHSHDIRIVVIRGAYVYKTQGGEEKRVGAGSYLIVPAGSVHVSSGDSKDGALFYEESQGQFDINFLETK